MVTGVQFTIPTLEIVDGSMIAISCPTICAVFANAEAKNHGEYLTNNDINWHIRTNLKYELLGI